MTTAATQGTASAQDAVAQASSVAIGSRQPDLLRHGVLLADLQRHRRDARLPRGLDGKLHSLGYLSGVYSSSASGIADLADAVDSGDYELPDDLWIANWNGQQNTVDTVVPANAWADHQRIHQYRGGHDETYGGHDDQHRQQLRRRRRPSAPRRRRSATPTRSATSTSPAHPSPATSGSRAGPSTRAPRPRRWRCACTSAAAQARPGRSSTNWGRSPTSHGPTLVPATAGPVPTTAST